MNGTRWPMTLMLIFGGVLVLTAIGFVALLATGSMTVDLFPDLNPATPTPEPTQMPTEIPGSIGGLVWHDLCASDEAYDTQLPSGCVRDRSALHANALYEPNEPGISGVEISLGRGTCPAAGFSSLVTNDDGSYLFAGLGPGTYCLSIPVSTGPNAAILQTGTWTRPLVIETSMSQTVTLNAGEVVLSNNFGWDYRSLPLPKPTQVPRATPTAIACTDRVTFVQDVSIPDNANLLPGKTIEKVWRLRNSGTCTWDTTYALVFSTGNLMGGPTRVSLSGSVKPENTVDLKVNLVAPSASGIYRGNWFLANTAGDLFGLGEYADKPFWVQIVVGPTGSTAFGSWSGEYFNNRELKGSATVVRSDAVINFDWKRDAPAASLPADNFSVRWTGKVNTESGNYRFHLRMDDGARLYIDNNLVIDEWKDGALRERTADVALAKGTHTIRVHYYERSGEARVELRWEKISSQAFSDWKGEYWTNRNLDGTPALMRNDKAVQFNWESLSPAVGIPKDEFSARWTRNLSFENGAYRFSAQADDGIRIKVDGKTIINEWHQSNGDDIYTASLDLSGSHTLTIEYYEAKGLAMIKVWWSRVEDTSTPTATPTATATPTPTATPTQHPPAQVYNFVDQACEATWRNDQDALACPGQEGAPAGFILPGNDLTLENGNEVEQALVIAPEMIDLGWIRGVYPAVFVQSGDELQGTLSCSLNMSGCRVEVEVGYMLADDTPQILGTWLEIYDGLTTKINLDLSALAGQTVRFYILVYAETGSPSNTIYFFNSGIWR